ncbi:16S rRNA (guanine(527)-N(7))-methyltransferase RsmG [Candidatus Symbiobacter mobilis]|uniref:Ribosomal RNA small subunit methyltransferase G n=1 Tax=Candidatus Symbiobacter mobilis CR TaxID=946483 RepID=U5NCH5_9BURK|nr:16S rRNA (guanine(527)-N(7))-methyltransferase RsmG [Candidatus Symbiobacter mobilis]AGX87849.1 glucose inhibited division protein B [Candidatus Symbiobacter mobilis CR]
MFLLTDALQDLGLSLSTQQIDQLLAYTDLIQRWGAVYNLTAIRDREGILRHHLADSLAVVGPLLRRCADLGIPTQSLLDVGSGAGLPGVVVAIACPEIAVDCVDKVAKKAAFVQQVATELELPRLRSLHSRVEALRGQYAVITSRAFASLADFTGCTGHLLREGGVWMAMKGAMPEQEMAALPATVQVREVDKLPVPGVQRCLVWMERHPEA